MDLSKIPKLVRLLPAVALTMISGFLFLRAIEMEFFASCFLDAHGAAIATEAARVGLSAPALFIVPLVLLPIAMLTAMATMGVRKWAQIVILFLVSTTATVGAIHVMSILEPSLFGTDPQPDECFDD